MQITLQQADIESAIKLFIAESGLTQEVTEISFSQTRKGGHSIAADVQLALPTVGGSKPANGVTPTGLASVAVPEDPITVETESTEVESTEAEESVEEKPASTPIFG